VPNISDSNWFNNYLEGLIAAKNGNIVLVFIINLDHKRHSAASSFSSTFCIFLQATDSKTSYCIENIITNNHADDKE
jgi:hypothetical protein